jgi:hypothetical protein
MQNISAAGLGPAYDHTDPSVSDNWEYDWSLGFGHSLGLNTGASGTGENHMKIFVRRAL